MDHNPYTELLKAPRGSIWAASAFSYCIERIGTFFSYVSEALTDRDSLENAKTPADIRRYAYMIQQREPSFAADLIAAANRADDNQ